MIDRQTMQSILDKAGLDDTTTYNMMADLSALFGDPRENRILPLRSVLLMATSWLSHLTTDNPFAEFLRVMHFDWADVRDLKEVEFPSDFEEYADYLISIEPQAEPSATRQALCLLQNWFMSRQAQYGECSLELKFFIFQLINNPSKHSLAERVAITSAAVSLYRRQATISITLAMILCLLGPLSGMTFLPYLFAGLDCAHFVTCIVRAELSKYQLRELADQITAALNGDLPALAE